MSSKIYITGLGVISGIGNNVPETLSALEKGKSGIAELENIRSRHKEIVPVGEVKKTNEELTALCGLPPEKQSTRTALLGLIAAKEAVQSAGITDMKEFRTGIISATSVGGMGMTEDLWFDYLNPEKTGPWLKYIEAHECGDSTEFIADALGVKDYLSTISTACSSSANSIMFGARLIKHGILDRVIVGGADSMSR